MLAFYEMVWLIGWLSMSNVQFVLVAVVCSLLWGNMAAVHGPCGSECAPVILGVMDVAGDCNKCK